MRSVILLSTVAAVLAVPYSEYILSPSTRTISPVSVLGTEGDVQDAANLTSPQGSGAATFNGVSSVVYDFGKNVAGYLAFHIDSLSDGATHSVGVTFTESSLWINDTYCDATQDDGLDFPLVFDVSAPGSYQAPPGRERGGFRYITFVHNTTGSATVSNLTVFFTPEPSKENPADYTGYFNSDNEKLNRVWYAGVYTNQLCTIDPTTGSALGLPTNFWYYNATISNGTSVLVDGGKRDRIVWPGDIFVSGPSIFVSTGNSDSIRTGIDSLLQIQNSDGKLPYCGDPFHAQLSESMGTYAWSFTYHLYSLIDIYDYYIFTGDIEYVKQTWNQFKLAMEYSLSTIDSSGLANVTSSADWLRFGMGGHNIEANAIFYYTLGLGIDLATAVGDSDVNSTWSAARSSIQTVANTLLWDSDANLFKDNETTTLHPQDGNVWAIVSGLVDLSRASIISDSLAARWGSYGAPAPEAGATVSPFISGIEIQAHYLAGQPARAVDLITFMWADFMLDDPRMTNSTFIEGYATSGDLVYAPYSLDERISHAHGWATGPTSVLTRYAVGVQLTGPAGKSWTMQPALGGIGRASAGYATALGSFSAEWVELESGGLNGTFETPSDTSGSLILEAGAKTVKVAGPNGTSEQDYSTTQGPITIEGLVGGKYEIEVVY